MSNSLTSKKIEAAEVAMLQKFEQAECPVVHHFGPGICMREVFMPAGVFAIGHHQKFDHLNIMLRGTVAVLEEGQLKILRAPLIFVGKPGRKIGFVIEDTVWQNVYATELRDPAEVENFFIEKSLSFQKHEAEVFELERAIRKPDRIDYAALLNELRLTEAQVRQQSENTTDQRNMPEEYAAHISIRPSAIEGQGLFLSSPRKAGELIAPARLRGLRTPAGRFTNHSKAPNAKFEQTSTGDIMLIALYDIAGSCGGNHGTEVTVDYRQALALNAEIFKQKGVEPCQQ